MNRGASLQRVTSLILLSFFFKHALAVKTDEIIRPVDAVIKETGELLRSGKFGELDKRAEKYRTKNVLTSDGQPKLVGFYGGVVEPVDGCKSLEGREARWRDHQQHLLNWAVHSPSAEAPKLALAGYEAAFGWCAWGGGYASTVTAENWEIFQRKIANSRALLEKLAPTARRNPEWYTHMLHVGLSQGWDADEFNSLFNEAAARFPSYYSLYFQAANYYSAIWYGSQEQFKAFVEATVAATEPRLGQTMYARLHWAQWEPDMFQNGKTDWTRMKVAFERLIKDFPDSWNRNNFAKFACMAGDKKTLSEQLDLIGKSVVPTAWDGKSFFQDCKKFASNAAA